MLFVSDPERRYFFMDSQVKQKEKFSILYSHKTKSIVETTANVIFFVCALVAIIAVFAITLYMIYSGAPALRCV